MHLNSESLILFEGTNSHLRISVNSMFSKTNKDNTTKPLVTISSQRNVTLRPNAFLVFAYYDGDFENLKQGSVYTSNPHLPKLRTIVSEIKDAILTGAAFNVNGEGNLFVNPKYEKPEEWIVPNIGKDGKSITFNLSVTSLHNDETGEYFPSVNIALSGAKEWCLLTIDEFLTVYQIIMDVNLTTLAAEMSNTDLIYDLITGGNSNGGYAPKSTGGYSNSNSGNGSRAVTGSPNNYVNGYSKGNSYHNGTGYQNKGNIPASAPKSNYSRPLPQEEDNDGYASANTSFTRPDDEPTATASTAVPTLNKSTENVEVEEEDWGSMAQIFTQSQRN